MDSLQELYRIGTGPSSSHTMGPRTAALAFLARGPNAAAYRVTLYGSLASTGKGHLTDTVLKQVFDKHPLTIVWKPEINLPFHPNGMKLEALDDAETLLSDGSHLVSFDRVIQVMKQTGRDLPSLYRETSCGGLASGNTATSPPLSEE
jgi:hypothetical protein